MTTPIFNQSTSFFDVSTADPAGILPLQADTSGAQVTGVQTVTNPLIPDVPTSQQLVNFPEELYDLRDTSVLVRFMKVLLGDAGAGQLRKRTMVTRLESDLSGANFYDLDRFYGALFGALRNPQEALSINPMNDVATPDEWDALLAADASFRERISNLAKGISMGATIPGLQMAAEAIVQAPVDIYESWQLLDAYASFLNPNPYTWDQIQTSFPTWNSFQSTDTWNAVEGTTTVGRTRTLSRSEIVIRPKKDYASTPGHQYDFPQDENALIRVLQKLRPAGTIITVDSGLGNPHQLTQISGLQADSEFWEVVPKVTPTIALDDPTDVYPVSAGQATAGVQGTDQRILPVPPWSSSGSRSWSYNALISGTKSYSFGAFDLSGDPTDPGDGTHSKTDDEAVTYRDGTVIHYTSVKGVLNSGLATSAHALSDGVLTAHPYTGDRKAVLSHD
jgi:hypothetical protein